MYLNLGAATVREAAVIGIFDLDTATVSRHTRAYLKKAEQNGRVVANDSYALPKSFLVCARKQTQTVYISQYAPSILQKRLEQAGQGEDSGK